ncbi:MAG: DUF4878 domain-containing protein [Acidobacteria bacterium]|nr:DUF4878 domain-containing protein [Acidobacteriota bacterium]
MKLRYLSLISIAGFSVLIAACGSSTETPVNNANSAGVKNTNTASNMGANAIAVTTPTPDQVNNDAPTLTPVYKAYCAAYAKKDEAAIRKFYTADTLKSLEEDMKDNNIKTLVEYLKDDKINSAVCSVSNERIKGDKAVARVKPSESYPNGFEVLFVKEGGEWKMSNITPEKGFQ